MIYFDLYGYWLFLKCDRKYHVKYILFIKYIILIHVLIKVSFILWFSFRIFLWIPSHKLLYSKLLCVQYKSFKIF